MANDTDTATRTSMGNVEMPTRVCMTPISHRRVSGRLRDFPMIFFQDVIFTQIDRSAGTCPFAHNKRRAQDSASSLSRTNFLAGLLSLLIGFKSVLQTLLLRVLYFALVICPVFQICFLTSIIPSRLSGTPLVLLVMIVVIADVSGGNAPPPPPPPPPRCGAWCLKTGGGEGVEETGRRRRRRSCV